MVPSYYPAKSEHVLQEEMEALRNTKFNLLIFFLVNTVKEMLDGNRLIHSKVFPLKYGTKGYINMGEMDCSYHHTGFPKNMSLTRKHIYTFVCHLTNSSHIYVITRVLFAVQYLMEVKVSNG